MNLTQTLAAQINIRLEKVQAAVNLLDSGNTIPFIARYRKEATGGLDEEQLRQIEEELDRLRKLEERKKTILASIQEQDKLTLELQVKLENAGSLTELEDLYAPYKPKRHTRASMARDLGLQGLADLIIQQPKGDMRPEIAALKYLTDRVLSVEAALSGAVDIVAETISDHPDVRRQAREKAMLNAVVYCSKIEDAVDERQTYAVYYEFECPVPRLRPHQVLALNRGEEEKVLRLKYSVPETDWRNAILMNFRADMRSHFFGLFQQAMTEAAERLLLPAIERDIRRSLTEKASRHAICVFADNLEALLMQPPLTGYTVLGIDPGFRTGCKVAVVGPTGKLLDAGTIYPHEPQKKTTEANKVLSALINKHQVTLISIGNGTASRETEQFVIRLIREFPQVRYVIASEAGASVYSASPLARAELPGLDVSLRGAVSIARRLQDPLAELVKIDPNAIGVGLYQHDVDQSELKHTLDGVVEDVVNRVGVDLNTASPALLTRVSGIGPKLADKIVAHREMMGKFTSRAQLLNVSGLGPKAFEQSAGFLRVLAGENPLDATAIHPESYDPARKCLSYAGINLTSSLSERKQGLEKLCMDEPMEALAQKVGCGALTLKDILEQLIRPGRDPREDLPTPILRSDVLGVDDLTPGMRLKGTVRNVVDFGAFVDIGVKQDGLLHRSQMIHGKILKVGEIIDVEVLKIEAARGRISLQQVE